MEPSTDRKTPIRPIRTDELGLVLGIVNAAAEAYRGVIPQDRWREPYMPAQELAEEIAAGVVFWGAEFDGRLAGVMGVQRAGEVDLIRHAYVSPNIQRSGLGGDLLAHLTARSERQVLVGTWAAAGWAIAFYERHGFRLVPPDERAGLLRAYWNIPDRQVETSVVLANPPLGRP